MGRLWDKFKYLGHYGTSAVFMCIDEITQEDVEGCSILQMKEAEADQYFRKSTQITTDPGLSYMLTMARAVMYAYLGNGTIALRIMENVKPPNDSETTIGFTLPTTDAVIGYLRTKIPT